MLLQIPQSSNSFLHLTIWDSTSNSRSSLEEIEKNLHRRIFVLMKSSKETNCDETFVLLYESKTKFVNGELTSVTTLKSRSYGNGKKMNDEGVQFLETKRKEHTVFIFSETNRWWSSKILNRETYEIHFEVKFSL